MGRKRKPRQGPKWPAKGGGGYDPNSPFALKYRGPNKINIAAVVRDPSTGKLVSVEYQASTQRHGKRGLTIARAVGPTEVAVHAHGAPALIPRAQIEARLAQMKRATLSTSQLRDRLTVAHEDWQSLRRQGKTEFHRIVLSDTKDTKGRTWYSLELYFSGRRWFFFEENLRTGWQSISIEYRDRGYAMLRYNSDDIDWAETKRIPPNASPAYPSSG